ncbi:hypothetical protein D4764_03G0012250 [Takifugu flavidus]|uniref:CCHC-type domain-containing protein n=1 Tax=Takifugu flavidus TaxID=433684 RepID=A0A5C6NFD0_9TELE|nr:hypothetical protein D4764_03G0012250 [Takifugu flavidus]
MAANADHRGGGVVQVTPLTQPAARITLSNVPPCVSDEFLARELSRHGKLVSPIRKLLSGAEEFNYRFVVRVDDFDYILFATFSALKCFNCGEEGHLARVCPSRPVPDAPVAESAAPDPAAPSGGEASVVRCAPPLYRTERKWSRRRREKGASVCV